MALRNKNKIDFINIALYIGIVAATIFAVLEGIKAYKKSRANRVTDNGVKPSTGADTPGYQTPTPATAAIDYDKKLKFGINAKPEVRILQEWVNRDGGRDASGKALVVDGLFGQKTKDALYNIKSVTEVSLNGYRLLPIKRPGQTGGDDGSGINPTVGTNGNMVIK